MRITIAQLNPTIGDTPGNIRKLLTALEQAKKERSDLLALPELYLVGYPPRDLLERKWFIRRGEDALRDVVGISSRCKGIGILVGVPIAHETPSGTGLHNSAALILDGEIVFVQHKTLLPTYDVFDEVRYFDPAERTAVVSFKNEKLGITICEDAWNEPEVMSRKYDVDPVDVLARQGATLFINISALPFHIRKESVRFRIVGNHARKHGVPFVFVNQVGANDELIFDGRSIFVDGSGNIVEALPPFEEAVRTVDTSARGNGRGYEPQEEIASAHDALVLGIRDYMGKCGFSKAVVGLSGGVDSAVVATLASRAVGGGNVLGVTMPSPYSSPQSAQLSEELASNLGIHFETIPISGVYDAYKEAICGPLEIEDEIDVTLENVQARIRGNILMAISNRYGHLVLSTGNKSELGVGYCTLYGDMSGGLAVLSDVPKTMVYEIAEFVNRDGEAIPRSIIARPPSAELRPGQLDQDTLPPYPVLDEILRLYIDEGQSVGEIVSGGIDRKTVMWVVGAINRNEYKRRQAAPGLKVTSKAFGMGRRMPIAARYDL